MPRPRLQFVGSCRNKADEERLQNLKNLAIDLKVEEDVEFYKNVMYRSARCQFVLCIHGHLIGFGFWNALMHMYLISDI